ncbi:MAG: hypothetical protein K8I03_09895 [Ignavibacteria bacterium]|nr:hypothetical protein [Ignavibacteria bacterium]
MKNIIKINNGGSSNIESSNLTAGYLTTKRIESFTAKNPYYEIAFPSYVFFHDINEKRLTRKIRIHPLTKRLAMYGTFGLGMLIIPISFALETLDMPDQESYEIYDLMKRYKNPFLMFIIAYQVKRWQEASLKSLLYSEDKLNLLSVIIKAGLGLKSERKIQQTNLIRAGTETDEQLAVFDANHIDRTIELSDKTMYEISRRLKPLTDRLVYRQVNYS